MPAALHFDRPAVLAGHTAAVYALRPWRGGVLSGGGDGMVVHWAAPYASGDRPVDGKLVARIDDRVFALETLTGAQDGQLVCGTLSGDLYWVDVAARTPPRRWQLHRDGLFGLCTAGAHLFAVGGGGQLSRWRIGDGTFEDATAVDTVRLRSVAYLPKDGLLVVGTAGGDLHLVDPASLRTVDVYERAHDNTVFDVAVGAGAFYTCGRDGAIRSWSWAGGALRQNTHVAAHGATVNALALRSDPSGDDGEGELLASAGRDREARLWRTAGGASLVLAKALNGPRDGGHAHSVNACCWTADGALATAGDDRTVRVWRATANHERGRTS